MTTKTRHLLPAWRWHHNDSFRR